MRRRSVVLTAIMMLSCFAICMAQGVSDTEILIGSSAALGGHASFLGTQTIHGAMSYINFINEEGGIHGRKIRIISYDDQYDPPQTIQNTNKLIDTDGVFCLFCYVGTPTSVKVIPIVKNKKVPLVGLFTGAEALRSPVSRYILNVRSSYYNETGELVKHLVEDLGIREIGVFYQYDAFGMAGLKGVEIGLEKYGLEPAAKGTYKRGTLEVTDGLEKIRAANPGAVIMIGVYGPCGQFIKEAKSAGYNPVFCNISFVGSEMLADLLGEDGGGVIISQVVPSPTESSLPAVAQYHELLAKSYPGDEPNFVSFEGFINAKVLVEGLKIAGRELIREKLVDAMEAMKDVDVGIGAAIRYGPQDHQGLDKVYFTKIQDGKVILFTDWKTMK